MSSTVAAAPAPLPQAQGTGGLRALAEELWRDKPGLTGFSIIVLLVLTAIFAPLLAPYDPADQSVIARLKPPAWLEGGTWEHFLGTDQLGRDIFSRIIFGARTSLLVGVLVVFFAGSFGVVLGL